MTKLNYFIPTATVNTPMSTVLQQMRTRGKGKNMVRKSIIQKLNPLVLTKPTSLTLY